MVSIAGDTDGSARFPMDFTYFAALQSDLHVDGAALGVLMASDDLSVRARTSTQLTTFAPVEPDVVDKRAWRNHAKGQTVASPRGFGRHDSWIQDASHALHQLCRQTPSIALHVIASPHALSC